MNTSAPVTHKFDVVITGGAMTGASLALAIEHFTNAGLTVAVVEVAILDDTKFSCDARSIALSYGSCQLLERIGVWQSLAPFATVINTIHISDQGHFGLTDIHANNEDIPFLGNVIELADARQVFHQALWNTTNVTLFCPAAVSSVERTIDEVLLTLNDGQTLKTKLWVAADGTISSCCKMLSIDHHEHDFKQIALIANITTELQHKGHAFERFTHSGPLALLPLSRGRCSLVWCLNSEDASVLLRSSNNEFLDALQRTFGWRLGRLVSVGQRRLYPLILHQSTRIISHRFAVVGNAAQTLHPIAGQGFNLGLRDVVTLAEEISSMYQQNQDCGEMEMLQSYQQRRFPDRNTIIAITSGLVHGFSNTSLPLTFGRNLSLVALSVFNGLKTPLFQHAMGLVRRP
ncbi:2-octaprenyl-6-methoxyphenyl hydroxylase [Candidatus Enterovibrio escicola]|uniref:2-octaprenyl-6-methoxyphenol hydroxylase n=1 Tax=Candidatus Enterovibrio escicola TaxID=1927127 RepID=A0A2A5T6D0_9GAMM|nr:2-octaprenyl-6-methoxyphenyl hydroxylase [Candidatus Enterovibrio escacola]PCS23688.1 2-octaprenyl-6-methoxyphenol hydroxylase [Candidatus Enterovibrio escacola]